MTSSLNSLQAALSSETVSKISFFRLALKSVADSTKGSDEFFDDFYSKQRIDFITCTWPNCYADADAMDKILSYTSKNGYTSRHLHRPKPDFSFSTHTGLAVSVEGQDVYVNRKKIAAAVKKVVPCSDGIILRLSEEPVYRAPVSITSIQSNE